MNQEDCVSFEVAMLLKEKGFREDVEAIFECNGDKVDFRTLEWTDNYNDEEGTPTYISAPTLWQVTKWLQEKGWYVQVTLSCYHPEFFADVHKITANGKGESVHVPGKYYTHEDAILAGIEAALKLI